MQKALNFRTFQYYALESSWKFVAMSFSRVALYTASEQTPRLEETNRNWLGKG